MMSQAVCAFAEAPRIYTAHLKLGLKFELTGWLVRVYLKVVTVKSFCGAFSHLTFGAMDGRFSLMQL